jgi:hypothetical protein
MNTRKALESSAIKIVLIIELLLTFNYSLAWGAFFSFFLIELTFNVNWNTCRLRRRSSCATVTSTRGGGSVTEAAAT